jgi:DNA-binding MarR family transcriptional regulator
MIGALLRFAHEEVLRRLLAALNGNGFDISPTELLVFLYPGPDGRRPSELARQCDMSRQAMNYVLAGLESRGYIERSDDPGSAARVVHLTEHGRQMVPLARQCVAGIEKEWAALLGPKRFESVCDALLDLGRHLGRTG